uniref:Kinesin family member 13B n=1 Tax=Myotis myotis TaxID=51298 RepID=A0A7J7XH29_MYOMY|nr:kinesin family member 13B [Myotis myotis]
MGDSKVKVAVRIRPMNRREIDLHTKCVVDVDANKVILNPVNTNLSKGDARSPVDVKVLEGRTLLRLEEEYLSFAFGLGSLYEQEGGKEGVKKVKLGKKEEINACFLLSKCKEINLSKETGIRL